jgi:hypothetical protein
MAQDKDNLTGPTNAKLIFGFHKGQRLSRLAE